MSEVNYSIRLDEDLREGMRDVPDITDRIRRFIRQEVERHEEGEQSSVARFCNRVLDEYGEVGAYCLYQLDFYIHRDQYYIENVETRFQNTDVDIEEARLSAKRIRNEWQELPRASEEVVEDILDLEGYIDEFYENARTVAATAVEEGGAHVWALWIVVQLFRSKEKHERGNSSTRNIKERSIKQTLEQHGYSENKI
jgi:hypothetical protein